MGLVSWRSCCWSIEGSRGRLKRKCIRGGLVEGITRRIREISSIIRSVYSSGINHNQRLLSTNHSQLLISKDNK